MCSRRSDRVRRLPGLDLPDSTAAWTKRHWEPSLLQQGTTEEQAIVTMHALCTVRRVPCTARNTTQTSAPMLLDGPHPAQMAAPSVRVACPPSRPPAKVLSSCDTYKSFSNYLRQLRSSVQACTHLKVVRLQSPA